MNLSFFLSVGSALGATYEMSSLVKTKTMLRVGSSQQTQTPLKSLCRDQTHLAVQDEQRDQKLTLFHIPRTGGASMEWCTKHEASVEDRWGYYKGKGIQYHSHNPGCSFHHEPPKLLQVNGSGPKVCHVKEMGSFPNFWRPMAENESGFCTVRDPYEKIISAFCRQHSGHTEDELNSFVAKVLSGLLGKPGESDVFDCHFMHQVAYVYNWNKSKDRRYVLDFDSFIDESEKCCRHVLHFDNYIEDFDNLMSQYGYPYRMQPKNPKSGTVSGEVCSQLKVDNLNSTVVKMIEDIYVRDFDLLGFKRLRDRK